jgi:hypothetical protein
MPNRIAARMANVFFIYHIVEIFYDGSGYVYARLSRLMRHVTRDIICRLLIILAGKCSRSDWGSDPRPMATPRSTKYQRFSPLSQIAILGNYVKLDDNVV